MKNVLRKYICIFVTILLCLVMSVPAFATSDSQEKLSSDSIFRDSITLQAGTIYLEDTPEYRIAFLIKNNGEIDYSVCYANNPGVVYAGEYLNRKTSSVNTSQFPDFVDEMLSLSPTRVTDFRYRIRPKSNQVIFTEEDALEYCERYAPNWRTPVNNDLLGMVSLQGLRVNVYESVNGIVVCEGLWDYLKGDYILDLITLPLRLEDIIVNFISTTLDSKGDIIAAINGSFSYFTVDNTRTKIATISGDTYFWSGWDMNYEVISGDTRTEVNTTRNYAHPDYNNSVSYFAEKAVESYNF